MRPLVTLTTDFGMRDPYVAAVKGQILSRCATNVEIVDLTHEIAPGNILEGALFLAGSVPYFPKGTFHVVVIDPGVGSERHPIVAKIGGQIVVCPDNGLLSLLCQREPLEEAYIITNREFMRSHVSATFHGRDIFAPTVRLLAAGRGLEEVGAVLDTVLTIPLPEPTRESGNRAVGEIIHVDRFGNCVTNIHRSIFEQEGDISITAGSLHLPMMSRTYRDVPVAEPLALIGSTDYLEISVNQGSAENAFGLSPGDPVEINW